MQIGIVWLPNVGKSTLFNALTKSYAADAANFPFCTIEPNVGVVDVQDPRLYQLSEISKTQKIIPATINFVDIAGLVQGASAGEWLGNQFLSHIRMVDAIVQVVRYFSNPDVVHVHGNTDPMRDIEVINTELILADLNTVERKLGDVAKRAKSGDSESKRLLSLYQQCKDHLSSGWLLVDLRDECAADERNNILQMQCLTSKPFVYAINVAESELAQAEQIKQEFSTKLNKPVAIVCAKFEAETMEMDEEERAMFVEELQWESWVSIPTLDGLISLAYDTVGLMYYFTTGEKETRARPLKKWSTAPQAAGVIHTDFERGFIKAEVVKCSDFITYGGRSGAKEKWSLKLEGKDYIVQDGDVMLFRFNV